MNLNLILQASVFVCAFTLTSGLNCFECAYKEDGSTPNIKSGCEKGSGNMVSTLCDQYETYCMKVSGVQIGDGGSVGLRGCALQWGKFLESEMAGVKSKCFSTASVIPVYELRILKTIIPHRDGQLCLCDSTECNGQGKLRPSVLWNILAIVLVAFFKIPL